MPTLHRVMATGINLRKAPNLDADVIVSFPMNHVMRVISSDTATGWSEVVTQFGLAELTGFVVTDLLAPLHEEPAEVGDLKVNATRLRQLSPNARASVINPLNARADGILAAYAINTKAGRLTHFLAQIAHECAGFRVVEENLNYSAGRLREIWPTRFTSDAIAARYARKPEKIANKVYADRMANGPESSGDGWRFRGRGLIQLTGRDNYTRFGDMIGVDLTINPDLAKEPVMALKLACAYWDMQKLNKLADRNQLSRITRKINGGLHGLEDRKAYLMRAQAIWGKD